VLIAKKNKEEGGRGETGVRQPKGSEKVVLIFTKTRTKGNLPFLCHRRGTRAAKNQSLRCRNSLANSIPVFLLFFGESTEFESQSEPEPFE